MAICFVAEKKGEGTCTPRGTCAKKRVARSGRKRGMDPDFIITSRRYYPAMQFQPPHKQRKAGQAKFNSSVPSPNTLDINTHFPHQTTPSPTKQPPTHLTSKWTPPPPPTARTAPSSGSTTRRDTASSPPRTAPPTSSSTSAPSRYVAPPSPAVSQNTPLTPTTEGRLQVP
jgi:hypothetical protein